MKRAILGLACFAAMAVCLEVRAESPLDTEFSYQGRLEIAGMPADGRFDIRFGLYDAPAEGNRIGKITALPDVLVNDGLFNTVLNFGPEAFNGQQRYLEILVRAGKETGTFTRLWPRQALGATPYALYALTTDDLGGGLATADSLTATVTLNNAALGLADDQSRTRAAIAVFEGGESGFAAWGPNGSLNLDLSAASNTPNMGFVGVADQRGEMQTALGVFDSGEGGTLSWGANDSLNLDLSASLGNPDLGYIGVADAVGDTQASMFIYGSGEGAFSSWGPNGSLNVDASSLTGEPNNGFIGVCDSGGELLAGAYVDDEGDGIVFGDYKFFVVDHPQQPDKKIIYVSLEGPEAAIFHRGVAFLQNGRAIIELPEHFIALADPKSHTVQLTPGSFNSQGLAYQFIDEQQIEIRELNGGQGSYSVSYIVHAQRADARDHQPVVAKTEFKRRFSSGGQSRGPDRSARQSLRSRKEHFSGGGAR